MSFTFTDLFCGGGGSSSGITQIEGTELVHAANHWDMAIEVHAANHPDADHSTADLHREHPRYFARTDFLWASPECTKWSQAGGAKNRPAIEEGLFEDPEADEAAQRSRLLMFDVLKFAEYHQYKAMVIENVVDIAVQAKYRLAWAEWRRQLTNLGYKFRVVSLNSMHAQHRGLPAPQSRDRLYIVCWLPPAPEPDLDAILSPQAWCPRCERLVDSHQSWKNGNTAGRYRQAYVYVCSTPRCGTVVEPGWLPASAAIDWAVTGTRIGDRDRPIAEKTRLRIAAGIARYWGDEFILEAAGNTFERIPGVRTWPSTEPLMTLHTSASKALAVPVEGRDGKQAAPMWLPGRTQTTRNETGLALLPFIAELRGGGSDARTVHEPAATFCASGTHHGLVQSDPYALLHRNNTGGAKMTAPATEYMRTLTTAGHQSLIQSPTLRKLRRHATAEELARAAEHVDDCLFRMLMPREIAAGMAFAADYVWQPDRQRKISDRNLVKMAGNAVTPPAARDLVGAIVAAQS